MNRLLVCFCALSSAVFAQTAATPPASRTPAKTTATPTEEEVVQLSPFEVSGAQDRGYQATATMSGTRLNTKIEDLAASLSVVTKQQLLDTAAVDINDVFL